MEDEEIMTRNEFGEIHETWIELMTIYDEIDALNASARPETEPGAYAAQTASA
ncbi:MAG: hypothetical protein Q7T80_04925 [Methanoregula sp.]|nr:hypothetical protein [Methanoregula sp.]